MYTIHSKSLNRKPMHRSANKSRHMVRHRNGQSDNKNEYRENNQASHSKTRHERKAN